MKTYPVDIVTWMSIICIVGFLLFMLVSLNGCVSGSYKDCSYERTKTVETELICDDGEETGTLILPAPPN